MYSVGGTANIVTSFDFNPSIKWQNSLDSRLPKFLVYRVAHFLRPFVWTQHWRLIYERHPVISRALQDIRFRDSGFVGYLLNFMRPDFTIVPQRETVEHLINFLRLAGLCPLLIPSLFLRHMAFNFFGRELDPAMFAA